MDKKINYFRLKVANQYEGELNDVDVRITNKTGEHYDFFVPHVPYSVDYYSGSTPSGGPDPSNTDVHIHFTDEDYLEIIEDHINNAYDNLQLLNNNIVDARTNAIIFTFNEFKQQLEAALAEQVDRENDDPDFYDDIERDRWADEQRDYDLDRNDDF
jgi:hypothetical protein